MINLREKTVEICKELSTEKLSLLPKEVPPTQDYYGFKPKKGFQLFSKPPVFKFNISFGKPTLVSLSREYDSAIEKIAKREDFAYYFTEPDKFAMYWC